MPKIKEAAGAAGSGVARAATKTVDKVTRAAGAAKEAAVRAAEKAGDKIGTVLTEEKIREILDTLYIKSVNGVDRISLPVDDLVQDYLSKNRSVSSAAKSLIRNSEIKCGASGFLTSLGEFTTLAAALPANVASVMYVQMRMCRAIARMAGYDIHTDQVQTMIYACLTGSAMADVLKSAGVKFAQKFGASMVKRIPFDVLKRINRAVGFRFITKFGEKGIINLGKVVPVAGGFIGGGVDVATTRTIGKNAYNLFIEGKISRDSREDGDFAPRTEAAPREDIDVITLRKAAEAENI